MTIENELIELTNLQQALADFENDPDTEFMEPELANQIRNKYKTLISKRQRRAKRKENIANLVESANEAEKLYSQADEMDKFANASLPEQIARGSYSAAMKFDGGAAKMYGTGKKLAGFTARWLSDDQGAVADWGKEQMRQGTEFNAAVDDYIAKASGFNSEWADTDNAQLLSPSTWTPASVLKAGEGLMEFEAPMATVGLVSGAVGKTLNPLTRTAMEGAMIGVGNIPEHSDYIEQGSGKFKPKQAIASGLLSGELMSFAFLAGRGRGLSEAAAMNYAQQVGRTGVLGMGKQVFKEAALTGLANATLSGGVGGGIKEYFALPENYTQKDLSDAIDRVFNQMGHEFVMGVGFGAHGAVKGLMEARSTYDRFVPKGSNKNIDTEVSKYFFGKEGQKILKESYPNLFAGEGSSADVNKFLEEVWNAIPNNLRAKNSPEMSGLFQNYRDALMAQWSMGKLEKTGIKNKIIEQFRARMAQRISDALNAAQATQAQINNIDKQIQSKDTPLLQKQELAKQAEELRAQRDLDSEKIETPYTYDDLMETSLNMVINKYGADSSLADRTIRLVDELSAQHGREYDVETFANLLSQVDVFLGQGNAGKNMRDWLLNRQSAEPRTESIPESVLRQQNNNQDDTILPNTPGYGIEPNFSPIESNRPIMPEDVIASQNRENNRILSDKSATQSDIATQNPVYPSGGYSNEKGNPMKFFGQDRPNIGMPSSVKSESPVEPPAMFLKGKKLESPSTTMNKSQKSETLQTKGVNTEKGELKDRDMPQSVMTDRSESPAIKNERGKMGLNVEMKQKEAVASKENPLENETVSELFDLLDNPKVNYKTKTKIKRELKRRNKIAVEKDLNEIKTVEEADRLLRDFLKTRDMFGGQQSRASDLHKRLLELERLNKESANKPNAEELGLTTKRDALIPKSELKYTERDLNFKRLMNLMQHRGIVDEISKKELEELAKQAGFKNVYEILNSDIGDDIMPFVKIFPKRLKSGKKSEKDFWVTYNKKSEQQIKNERAEYQAEQSRKEQAEYQAELIKKYPILNDIDTNTKLWNAIENTNSKELQDILLAENAKRFEQARNSGNLEKWIKERTAFDNAKQSATEKSSAVENIVRGKKTRMTTKANGGMKVDGEFAVVDVNKLKTATDIGETQNRNRKTIASQAQVNSIANNPNPEYLIVDNPDSANGAMVIASDGTVLSGNGRTLGLSEAYKYGNADKYKAYLKEHASEFGIDPREIDKIENPVLVRIVDSKDGFDVKRFVKESNESRQLGRNAAEIARTDAENIKGILREFNSIDDITSPSNKEFIQKFFENTVGDTERANYLAEDGSLTQDGQRRIENALIASLYGNNPRLIEKLANTTNTGIKNVAKALIATAKDGAKLKGEVDKGMYFDVDLNKEISDAALTYADTVAEMHRQGVNGSPINFYLANMKDRLTPEGKLVFGMLSELNNKPKQVREFLQIINDVIRGHGDPQQGDLFAGKNPKPNKLQIIKEALQEFDSRYKTDFSKQDLSKWNKSERTLFDIGNEVREDGTPASVKKFIPDYKNKKKSSWTKEDWEDYDKDQTKIAYDILGEENTDTTPIEKTNDIKLSKQQQNMYKSLKEFLPDIFEVYDREAESPAPVQALMNILRGGESLADIETAITRGDSREAIDIIENIKQRVELTYSKDFSNKIAKNCDRLIKMIKNSNYRSNAIKPISLEELEAQPIKRMPQGDVEGWREQRKAYLEDRRTTSLSKFHKKVFANEARIVSRMYKNRQITNEQRKLFHKILKADYDYNVSVDGSNLTEKQEQIATKAIDKFNKNVNELINQLNNGKISFEDFVKERHQASIDYHTSLANDGIQSNAMRRTTIDPNRHKPQLSRIKNKATNPVTDKELNNFLRGQAKQISQETGLSFKVVNSVDELRKMFPNNDITDTVEGGIHKDTVYLVKGNIDKDRLPLVIAHEVAGHRGVESLFENKQQMDNFFNSLERAAAKDKFIRDAFAEVDRLGYKENRSREAMAKIVERVRNESGTLKGTAKTFVNFITSRVRRLLRRMGFKNLQLNEAEVYDIAVQALRRTGLKNSNKFFGLDRFFAKDNSFLSATSTELDQKYPGWQNQTNDSGGHTTQIKATVNTYRKIGEWIKNNMKGAKILDASSGLGEGTEALKQMGLNIEDVEPYASNKRKNAPIYDSYDKIKGKYDAIISNAVLNVIPDNWRSELLHNMVDKLNDGGKLFINVRDAKEVSGQKQKVELDSPSEILVTNGKGGYRAYQKGFTQPELESWVKKELGSGYKVEKANEKNSGMPSGSRAVVITKEGGNGDKRTNPRYEEITKQLNAKQLGNREFNNKATELGALKTLQGTKIERYKKTVGKEVSGQVYVHKNYANEVIPNEILDKAKKILSEKNPSFKYNTLMWDKNKGTIRFDEAPNFDTAPEPIPGKMLSVNPITGEVKEAYSSKIWHHKWQWVKDDYNGFDIKESWNRSREWLNGLANLNLEKDNPDYSIVNNGIANGKANGYEAWNKQLKYYGLDHLIDDKNNTVPKADIQFSIGERKPRKVKPDVVSEAEKKILDEIGEVKNPRDYNAVKKIAKNRMAEYKDVFSTKKNTGYKTAALKLHYLLGFDRKTQSVEKAFQSIRDFNTLQKTASAYARSIIGDKSTQASILDSIVKAKTFEKVYDIISKTNIAKEREIRKDLLDDFRNTIKELNPKKISTPTRMYTDEILGESFTPEELDSLIHSNEFTTKAVGKLRNIADNLASELGNIRKSDIEVSEYAINNAARLKHELNEIIKQRDAGNGAMNVPVEKLAEVNQLLKRFVNQDKLYKESLDTSAKNAAVADREQILSESPEKNPKTVNSRETNSIGRFKEYFLPGKALKTQDNENVAATMGKTMHKVAYEDLLEGQNRQDHYRATGYKGVDKIMESFGKDLEDGREYLDKTAFKVKTSEGHEYEITNNEALAIIANYLDRETGQMIKKAGKVNFYLGEKKDSDYFTFTRKELDDMVNKLTPKQKKAIEDGFALLSNDFLPELNRVYEKLNGVPLRLIQGRYFPRMHVDVTQSGSNGLITKDRAPYIHQQMNADYQGILKQRDAMATPNLNLRGFTDTLQNYTDQASLYIGMAEPLRHLNRIMNGQMKRELTARYGAEYVNRINQMTRLMAGMAGKTEVDKGFATRYLSNLAAAKLTPLSAIKQLTSVPLASSVIPAEYLAKASISGMSNENIKEMMELDGMVLRYRSNGIAGIIPVNAKTWGRERIQGEKFKGQKLIDKAVGVGLNLSIMADKRALGIIYKATKLWAESQGKGSDKAWIENKFMEAVRRTQNTTDLASATGWQMDSRESGTMAFLNMYLNQTQKVSNEFFRNKRLMDEAAKKYGKDSAQYKEARNRTATFAASAALMEAMMLAIGSGASMLFKGKDEDSVKDKAVTAVSDLTGNPLLKPMINAYSLQGVLKGKKPTNAAVFGDDFSGMIPEIAYTMGRVMNDLQSDDPVARKFRKLSYDMLSSKAAETSLALGRVPTWFARYPAKFIKRIWGEDLKNTRQKPSISSSSGSSRLFSGKRMFGNSRTFGGKRMF